jgi:hypothetical protein
MYVVLLLLLFPFTHVAIIVCDINFYNNCVNREFWKKNYVMLITDYYKR